MYIVRVLSFGEARSYIVCEAHRGQPDAKFGGTVVSVKYAPGDATACDLCKGKGAL